jgi:hypothetical protein
MRTITGLMAGVNLLHALFGIDLKTNQEDNVIKDGWPGRAVSMDMNRRNLDDEVII